MQDTQGKVIAAVMEQLIQAGPEGMAEAFTTLFNLAMRMEREQHLDAGAYERTEARRGYANGYKPKKVDTPAGTLTVQVPKSRGCDEPFFPRSLERGRRSSRAIMLAIAEMYIQGVSTRDAAKVMREFGLESLSSTQVSRAAALLDEELEAWRTRRLDPVNYLILDARYEKVREGGVSRAGESHPRALAEPDVRLSPHPAPIVQPYPCRSGQWANRLGLRRAMRASQCRDRRLCRLRDLNFRCAHRARLQLR